MYMYMYVCVVGSDCDCVGGCGCNCVGAEGSVWVGEGKMCVWVRLCVCV